MKGSSYRERDYVFGQAMLTVRTKLRLTQAELADLLGIRRRAITDWEGGLTYPNVDHLKHFVVLAIERQAFSVGREIEEIRTLWQAAHQKVLLDETWLGGLLSDIQDPHSLTSPSGEGPHIDWGDALSATNFYGRAWELDLLSQWVVEERCRVVSVLGQGGIGKSALATQLMHRVAEHFEVVIWRSLRDVPTCEALLDSCLQVLVPQTLRDISAHPERRQDLLLECLRNKRVLLIYDNLESFLEEGEDIGRMRAGYEGFSRVLHRVAETEHQSCLLLTSREKPSELVPASGTSSPVRALRLAGLDDLAGAQLLEEKGVVGSTSEQLRLIEAYAGNPLALKIVAETIADLFGGAIEQFLSGGTIIFGSITKLLEEQWARLSPLEQTVLCWLATLREAVTLTDLLTVLVAPRSHAQVLEAVDRLRRRSLIERGLRAGSFTLQSVVLEYVTTKLVAMASEEIQQGRLLRLREQSLSQAQAKEYVRQTQERLLLDPLLAHLQSIYQGRAEVERQLHAVFDALRERTEEAQGYGPANLVALLRVLHGHLRGLDLSHVILRGVSLQGVEMQDASLAGATLHDAVFTESFDMIRTLAISPDGHSWAAGSRRGNVQVWRQGGKILHQSWQAHTDTVRSLAFSSLDSTTLATGSWDGAIKLWDLERGALLWANWLPTKIQRIAFAPNGRTLASGGGDGIVRLWDTTSGALLRTLPSQSRQVQALAWSPDGHLLASGSDDGSIRIW
jgi:transcriptional regulator with XRE-family HTH domain